MLLEKPAHKNKTFPHTNNIIFVTAQQKIFFNARWSLYGCEERIGCVIR